MKCFERILLNQLMKHTKPHINLYQFTYMHCRSTEDATLTLAYILILRNQVHLSEFSSSAFLLPSIPYNHTSWQANVWNSSLTQDWFSGLSTFLSIVLRQFVTKLYFVFPFYFHRLSTRHCPISYSFHTRYKWLHRHWHNIKHKILWRFCNGRSLQLRFCSFWWSWKR